MPVQIIAHRGASFVEPENTLAAFSRAIAMGADYLEFDVRRSRDGKLYIRHDPDLAGMPLASLSYAEIGKLSGGADIPLLADVVELAAGKIKLDVELKEPGFEAEVLKIVGQYFSPDDFVVTSFDDAIIGRIKALDGRVRTGLLVGKKLHQQSLRGHWQDLSPLKRLTSIRADFVACHYIFGDLLTRRLTRRLGIPLVIWTVDKPELLRKYMGEPHVLGIVTNRPDVMYKLRETYKSQY